MTDADGTGGDPGGLRHDAWNWVLRITSGDATKIDVAELERWCAKSPRHREAFARASSRWRLLGSAIENIGLQDAGIRLGSRPRPAIGRRAFLGGAAAASAAAGAFLAVRPPLALWPSVTEFAADYRTATGGRQQIALGNGASVDMNTRTSMNIRPGGGGIDSVELLAGEATIATGPRQVEVVAGNGRALAEGARFNVRYDGPAARVTCMDGLVQVRLQEQSVLIRANQQVTYDAWQVRQMTEVDPALVTGWLKGDLFFQNEPLSDVIDEVNRYRPGRIVLMNDELGRRRFTARFKLDRLEGVITQLQAMFGARVTSLPRGIVLLS